MNVGAFGGFNYLFVGGIRASVKDVFLDTCVEEVNVLLHNTDAAAQAVERDGVDINAVNENMAGGNIVKVRN